MRILLTSVDSKFIHSNLALRYLEQIGKQASEDVCLYETTINEDVDFILADLISHHPDLLVFSCYIWNISLIKQLISAFNKVYPDTLILCGGPEVAYDAEEFLASTAAHGVMAGEGEAIFPGLLKTLRIAKNDGAKKPEEWLKALENVPGLYLKSVHNEIKSTGKVDLIDMKEVPFPYDPSSLEGLKNRIIYYEGQRGCPYECSYCLSSIDRKLRHKPVDMVCEELTVFLKAKVPLVKFVDRTFNVAEKWSFEVLSFIVNETVANNYQTSFHFEVGAATLSDRIIKLLNQSPKGLFQIEAGIQSTNPKVLQLIQRKDDPEQLTKTLGQIIAGNNVHVHTDLIAGLPGQSLISFKQSFNESLAMKPQMLQVGFLKVLKGSPLYKSRNELGIVYRDWPPYEVLKTAHMSFWDLHKIKKIDEITVKYYNSGKYVNSMNFLLSNPGDYWDLFIKMADYLSEYQKKKNRLHSDDYYRVILDLCKELEGENAAILADLLRFDYILMNRKGHVPEWLRNKNYNSLRARLVNDDNENSWLKGTVARFKINVLSFWQSQKIIEEDTHVFYSLATSEIIKVKHVEGKDYRPV